MNMQARNSSMIYVDEESEVTYCVLQNLKSGNPDHAVNGDNTDKITTAVKVDGVYQGPFPDSTGWNGAQPNSGLNLTVPNFKQNIVEEAKDGDGVQRFSEQQLMSLMSNLVSYNGRPLGSEQRRSRDDGGGGVVTSFPEMKTGPDVKPQQQQPADGKIRKRIRKSSTNLKSAKTFVCDLCGDEFRRPSDFRKHLRLQHEADDRIFSCTVCEYKCTAAYRLKSHMLKHTSGEKPFSCSFCEYRCSFTSSLKRHMSSHTGFKPYSCSFCDYKCSVLYVLKTHLRTHTGDKPFACQLCDFRCAVGTSLKRHLLTHSGEKRFSCTFCSYKCSVFYALKKHLRIHTGEKPYSCTCCSYKCSVSTSLKRHLRTHTGSKAYSCQYCEFQCATSSTFKKHMHSHNDR